MSNWTLVVKKSRAFGGKYGPYYDRPVVFIAGDGSLLLTPLVFEMLGSPTEVEILDDARAKIFSLRPTTAENWRTAFKSSATGGGKSKGRMTRVSCLGFTKDKGIPIKGHTILLNCEVDGEGQIIISYKDTKHIL